jgi:hypothetical protein
MGSTPTQSIFLLSWRYRIELSSFLVVVDKENLPLPELRILLQAIFTVPAPSTRLPSIISLFLGSAKGELDVRYSTQGLSQLGVSGT